MSHLSLVDSARPGEWDGILADTRDMLAAATAGDWDRTVRLERTRHARISRFFSAPPAAHEAPWVRRGIEEILASDAHLLALCQTSRAGASAEIVDLRRKAAANRAYGATSVA